MNIKNKFVSVATVATMSGMVVGGTAMSAQAEDVVKSDATVSAAKGADAGSVELNIEDATTSDAYTVTADKKDADGKDINLTAKVGEKLIIANLTAGETYVFTITEADDTQITVNYDVPVLETTTPAPVETTEPAPVEETPTQEPTIESPTPVETTEPAPVETTEPAPTTEEPAPTTEEPDPTTEEPAPTTEEPAPEPIKVDAEKPVIIDNPGFEEDSVSAPENNSRITYTLSYDKETGEWSMVAKATEGYIFSDGTNENTQTGMLDITKPVVKVALTDVAKPRVYDNAGWLMDRVFAPMDTESIDYKLTYVKKTGEYTLTAKAMEGYEFENGETVITQTGKLDVNPVVIPSSDLSKPVISDNAGWNNDKVKAPRNTNIIHYGVYHNKKTGVWEQYAFTTKPGYVFDNGKAFVKTTGKLDVTPVTVQQKPDQRRGFGFYEIIRGWFGR